MVCYNCFGDNMNKQRSKKSIIISISVAILLIIILTINILEKPKKEVKDEIEEVNLLKDSSKIDALFAYSGTYIKNSFVIVMNVTSKETIDFTITNGKDFINTTLELDKDNNLINKEKFKEDETATIKLTKIKEGLKIETSTKKEDSIFKKIANTYEISKIKDTGWSGYYEKDGNYIIIDEYDEKTIYLSVKEIDYVIYIEDYDKDKIVLEEAFLSGVEKVTITKTKKGINISSNKKGNKYLFAKVSGEYEKKN